MKLDDEGFSRLAIRLRQFLRDAERRDAWEEWGVIRTVANQIAFEATLDQPYLKGRAEREAFLASIECAPGEKDIA